MGSKFKPAIKTMVSDGKQAFILILLTVAVTTVDSQLVNVLYGTRFGTPGIPHLLLFVTLVILSAIISTTAMLFAKRNDIQPTGSRPLLFKIAYWGTSAVLCTLLSIIIIMLSEMSIFHEYSKIFSLLVINISHFWSAIVLGIVTITFMHWFRYTKSFSIFIYAVVFIVIIFLGLMTILLLTEQFTIQFQLIYPRDYTILIQTVLIPSPEIAFIYGLGQFTLPVMIVSSWILTVSLLKQYADKTGRLTFWLIVSIPLLYQLFTYIVKDTGLLTDPALVEIVYSKPFQFLFSISYQITGSFFAISYLIIARKIKRNIMKNYLIICSLGIIFLFSSIQPGLPFYAAYPPFGLITLLYLAISSYLLVVGMLGCAAYVSRDTELRREIHKGLEVNSEFINKMGMAEIQREMERRILPVVKKVKLSDEMKERMDPDEEDIKLMIREVLNEIRSKESQN